MSDATTDRSDRQDDRPDEVTDPLLWKLALGVADAHEPDGDGGCRNLLCAGQAWPCPAWNNAQLALRMARTGSTRPSSDVTAGQPDGHGGRTGLPEVAARRNRPVPPRASAA
ncbi:hypothetical protein GA0070606_0160 [Micromonospora citrea]|uniref:Uncharacterized protein n=1 Tax=Micromonospora citrea TaxID=47855 RepID=A0A1C6TR58_9ACTN|nr:hypothetical protein [Micromonospora citrea]SCL44148.1 hypothetical protein GA0070606_0160 [Micromonospora citrea]